MLAASWASSVPSESCTARCALWAALTLHGDGLRDDKCPGSVSWAASAPLRESFGHFEIRVWGTALMQAADGNRALLQHLLVLGCAVAKQLAENLRSHLVRACSRTAPDNKDGVLVQRMLVLGCAVGLVALLPVYLKHVAVRRAAAQAPPELVKKPD